MLTILEQKVANDGEGFITLAERKLSNRTEWVTWRSNSETEDFYWGHYYDDLESAKRDFDKRG